MTVAERTLVLDALPFVDRLVDGYLRAHRVPRDRHGDLHADAHVAACRAARRYDPTTGIPFNGYLRARVIGAVIDSIRDQSHGGRYHRMTHAPLEWFDLDTTDDDRAPYHLPVEDDPCVGVLGVLDLVEFVAGLDDRERRIVALLADGETLASIADRYGLTESRVCQIRRSIGEQYRRLYGVRAS